MIKRLIIGGIIMAFILAQPRNPYEDTTQVGGSGYSTQRTTYNPNAPRIYPNNTTLTSKVAQPRNPYKNTTQVERRLELKLTQEELAEKRGK